MCFHTPVDGFAGLGGLGIFSVGTFSVGTDGLALSSASTRDNCATLPAAKLAVDVAVGAPVGCGLVVPITPCEAGMSFYSVARSLLCTVPNMLASGTVFGLCTRHRKIPNPV